MNTATIANLCVVVLYLLAMAGMGVYFMKRNSDTEAYFLGGRMPRNGLIFTIFPIF